MLLKSSSLSTRGDEEYYTAEEDSEEGTSEDLLRERSVSFSRSDSLGFVLGGEEHERLEDFRKRIRKRTRRRLSRRSSRNSYLSSSGSSDMEDISEDPEEYQERVIRPASSEPSIVAAVAENPHLSSVAVLRSRKTMMVTSSNGHLKAYSYDGVSPNLPVPFKAKFRRRRKNTFTYSVAIQPWDENECQLKMMVQWLAASMADMQFCILYTLQQPLLQEACEVYSQVLHREWTVGDLSCELLRYCRNRISTRHRTQLFSQLMGSTEKNTH